MVHRKVILFSSLVLLVLVLPFAYTQADENLDDEQMMQRKKNREEIVRKRKRPTGGYEETTTHSFPHSTHDLPDTTTHSPPHTTTHSTPYTTTHSTPYTTTHSTPYTTTKRSRTRPTKMMTTKMMTTTTNYYHHTPYEPSEEKYEKKYRKYGNNNRYGNDRYNKNDYEVIGHDGRDPGEYGQDIADFGPIYSDRESMYASMNIWISAADDWENHDRPKYRKKYGGNKYNKDKNYKDKNYKDNDYKDKNYKDNDDKDKKYKDNDDKDKKYKDNDYKDKDSYESDDKDDDDYKKNDRKKRSYSRVKFPVRHFKDIRKFPHKRFPPLISIFPWLPIFYDKITYQTFIFSPTGGIYILPPLINFYGQRFAVAQLIKWGYASLVSSGAPPPPNVNVAPLVQPAPAAGVPPAGVAGGSSAAPAPAYDSNKYRFNGGVKTDFPDFKPRYRQAPEEGGDGYGNNRPVNRNTYGTDSNYGGTGRQEVYPQGGPRSGGGGPRSGGGGGGYN